MTESIQYNLNFSTNAGNIFVDINEGFNGVQKSVEKTTKSFGDCFKSLLSFSLALDGVNQLKDSLDGLIAPGIALNTQMHDLSAITGQVGEGLKKIELNARESAKVFGTDATQNIESYKLLLSQLSPEIAKNDTALKMMGDNVNYLSKTMNNDTVAATEVLTTAMNQYGVSLDDPIQAGKQMTKMMNTMSAGAKEGSAEMPQIKAALEQSGMAAKAANVSFEELNAGIQILDKAGKKGSEGGVALRNTLATLSQGRFLPKEVKKELTDAGVSLQKLSDTTVPLTTRLRALLPIQNDAALLTKLFGKENSNAALALLNGVDAMDELTVAVTGTNTAIDQAKTVMGSYQEGMKRSMAVINDYKISFFQMVEPIMPAVQHTFEFISATGQLAVSLNALNTIYNAFNIHVWRGIKLWWSNTMATLMNTKITRANTIGLIQNAIARTRLSITSFLLSSRLRAVNIQLAAGIALSTISSKGIMSVTRSFGMATLGVTGFKIALSALGIGLIITAITGLVYGLKHLWDHSRKFNEVLGYIAGAGKAVFHNIGVYVSRVWRLILKPIASFLWDSYVSAWMTIWDAVKTVWDGISYMTLVAWNEVIKPVALFIWDTYTMVWTYIWKAVKWVFQSIITTGKMMWNWFSSTFSGFASWLNEVFIEPIRNAFSGIWTWITSLLDNIFNKMSGILEPIKKLWNTIFSSEGTLDIHASGLEGAEEYGKAFDKRKAEKQKKEPLEIELKQEESLLKKISPPPTKPIGGVAAKKEKSKTEKQGGKRVGDLNINKLVENVNIYQQNGAAMTKTQLIQMIKEALLTASADYTLAQN